MKSKLANHRVAFGKEEELQIGRPNQRATFGKVEELEMGRNNQKAGFGKGEELEIEQSERGIWQEGGARDRKDQ